jgi:hypothetical protein
VFQALTPFTRHFAMETAFADLAAALRERLGIIADENSRGAPERHVARLQAVSEKIDCLCGALPQPIDAQLKHYLERRSYDKALELLQTM